MHSWRIRTGFEQLEGEGALVKDGLTSRLAVSSWLLILGLVYRSLIPGNQEHKLLLLLYMYDKIKNIS